MTMRDERGRFVRTPTAAAAERAYAAASQREHGPDTSWAISYWLTVGLIIAAILVVGVYLWIEP